MTVAPRPIDSPWITLAEACEYARFGEDTVGAALRSGELHGRQAKRGGPWRIRREHLDAWLEGTQPDLSVPRVTRRLSDPDIAAPRKNPWPPA